MRIWFIDDKKDNQITWLNSFSDELKSSNEFRTFDSVPELLETFEKQSYPDILFLDFFIGGMYGLDIINYFKEKPENKPLIIAHSSMDSANDGMVKKGADLKLNKTRGANKTESIVNTITSQEDLKNLVKLKNEQT